MNRLGKGFVLLSLLAVLAFSAVPARATWYFTHGAAAVIQPSCLDDVATYDVAGWGLRVTIKKGKSIWVHMPLTNPALEGIAANQFQLNWRASSKAISITGVDVYDGGYKFWAKQGNWKGYSVGVDKTTTWSLGQSWNISRGFGISFLVANKGAADAEVAFSSAGVYFEDR